MTQTHAEWAAAARAEREAKARKRYESSIKPGKPIQYRFGDDTVILTKLPMEYHYPAGAYGDSLPSSPKFKSKYLATLNGVERAHIVCENGWGSHWIVTPVEEGFAASVMRLPTRPGVDAKDVLAAAIPKLVQERKLPTPAERAAHQQEAQERSAKEAHAFLVKSRTTAVERVDRFNALLAQLVADHATLEGLVARGVLTTSETEVIWRLIEEMVGQLQRERGNLKDAQERLAKLNDKLGPAA